MGLTLLLRVPHEIFAQEGLLHGFFSDRIFRGLVELENIWIFSNGCTCGENVFLINEILHKIPSWVPEIQQKWTIV